MAFGRRKVQTAVGTATASDVLSGFTFSSAGAGVNAKGLMPNEGQPILQPGDAIATGYYSGGQAAAPGSGSVSFTTPGSFSWTVPSGVTRIFLGWVGGGGGGGGGYSTTYTGGAGGIAIASLAFLQVTSGDVLSGQIGAGGTAGVGGSAPTAGGNGGSTTITSQLLGWTLNGSVGYGGGAATSTANGENGGGASTTASGITPVWVLGGTFTEAAQPENGTAGALLKNGALSGVIVAANLGFTQNGGGGAGGAVDANGSAGVDGAIQIYW